MVVIIVFTCRRFAESIELFSTKSRWLVIQWQFVRVYLFTDVYRLSESYRHGWTVKSSQE